MGRITEAHVPDNAGIHRITALAISWALVLCCLSSSREIPCPPAKEGQSYALECISRGQSYWQLLVQTSGSTEQVKVCPESGTCDWGEFGNVSVMARQVEDGYVSNINVSRVTTTWRNQILRCVAENETSIMNTLTAECKMDNFHKPDSAQCDAVKVGDKHIRVTCRTTGIYPRLRCQVKQFGSNLSEQVMIEDGLEYTDLMQPNGLYNSTCSVDIQDLRPGKYRYFCVLIPSVDKTYVRNMSVAVMPTSPIEIQAVKPDVWILPPSSVRVCPDTQKPIIFTCRAHKFESRPNFEWSFWDPDINKTIGHSHSTAVTLADGSDYMSSYNTHIGREHVRKHIECSASTFHNTYKHRVPVNVLLIPPPTPFFTEFKGQRLGNTLSLNESHRLTIACTVETDEKDLLLHVRCHRNNVMFLSKHVADNKFTFPVTGWSFYSSNCTCTVQHQCYNLTAALYIEFGPNQNITKTHGNADSEIIPDDTGIHLTFHIFIGVVGLLLLVLVIFCLISVCFFRRRTPHRQIRTYSKEHVYETVP